MPAHTLHVLVLALSTVWKFSPEFCTRLNFPSSFRAGPKMGALSALVNACNSSTVAEGQLFESCSEKAWRIDNPQDKYPSTFNSTRKGLPHAVDNNCHPARALAAWFARPRWRQFDPSTARNCCHRPDY